MQWKQSFFNALHEEASDIKSHLNRIMVEMEENMLVAHDTVQQICGTFWRVIGGEAESLFWDTESGNTEIHQPSVSPTTSSRFSDSQSNHPDQLLISMVNQRTKPSEGDLQLLASRGEELLKVPQSAEMALKMLRYATEFGNIKAFKLL